MQVNRRLTRCRHDRRLAGVAAGMAEFFDLDPTLVRLLWFLSIFVTGGLSILLYIGLAFIVPNEPMTDVEIGDAAAAGSDAHRHAARGEGSGRVTTFIGLGLILFGGLALLDALLPSWVDSWRYLGPAFFVGIGALLVLGAMRRESTDHTEVMGSPES
jgi:phage shock protein PspC (stress-responsive transcriptional regulator)